MTTTYVSPVVWHTGPFICAHCGHRWMAFRPLESVALECPDCHHMTYDTKNRLTEVTDVPNRD